MENLTLVRFWLSLLILALGSNSILAQQTPSRTEKQPWVKGILPPVKGNYRYLVAHGQGKSVKASREDARLFLLIELGFSKGIKVQGKSRIEAQSEDRYAGKTGSYNESTKYIDTYEINGNGYSVSVAAVDEYYEKDASHYQMWVLYEVSEKTFTPVLPKYTNVYGFGAVWRSAIIPGWGQFYKKQSGKGLFFLATEGALMGTVIYSGMQYNNNVRKSEETTKLALIKEYRNRADQWKLRQNIAIGAVAGVYVWNVLDAALTKGKLKYAWIPDDLGLTAYTNTNGQNFYGLTFKF